MDAASAERKLGQFLPKFCLASFSTLVLAFLLGGLSTSTTPSLVQNFSRQFFTLYILFVPIIFIAYLFYIEFLRNRESKRATSDTSKLLYDDAFDLPSQEMHGYKIVFLSGEIPTLTGLTGDLYVADDMAKCEMNRDHVPPVAGCDCGFYAYSDIKTAEYQLSINPTSFLIDVDLFGVGFAYSRGFRAESQVVNFMSLPRRCMRCKVLKPEQFVKSYKFGFNSHGYWRWEFRCKVCSYNFKEDDCLSAEEMSQALGIKTVR